MMQTIDFFSLHIIAVSNLIRYLKQTSYFIVFSIFSEDIPKSVASAKVNETLQGFLVPLTYMLVSKWPFKGKKF